MVKCRQLFYDIPRTCAIRTLALPPLTETAPPPISALLLQKVLKGTTFQLVHQGRYETQRERIDTLMDREVGTEIEREEMRTRAKRVREAKNEVELEVDRSLIFVEDASVRMRNIETTQQPCTKENRPPKQHGNRATSRPMQRVHVRPG